MKIIKYKMVDKDGYTRRGIVGETYWLDGKEKIAIGESNTLCSKDVIHYYDHPLLAVLFNPIHADIENPRLIEIQIDKQCAHDGLKGGCKKAKHVKEIEPPAITKVQRVTFAILVSLEYYADKAYRKWAENWLNGKDRSEESAAESAARSAARSVESAAWSAAWSAAESAARSAARSVESAAWSAARSAAESAAESAARSVESAARSAWSAARSAESAARSAWSAARPAWSAAKVNKLFIKTIEEIVHG